MVLLYYSASYYPVRGGASGTGFSCGLYITNMNILNNFYGYFVGAALSLVHIILVVVVILEVMSFAEFSLLLSVMVLVLSPGTMVLLYH